MSKLKGGARLMIGFSGTSVKAEFAETLIETGARSVVLFARNVVDAAQTRRLTDSIRALVDWPLVIAIDQEGGSVVRLEKGVAVFPGNMTLGAGSDEKTAEEVGRALASEMSACGIDLVLAPVVDLQVSDENPIVGFRSFGTDEDRVVALARATVRGFEQGGCSACLKHFPGLGLAVVDPHVGLPVIHATEEEMVRPHMKIFADVLEQGGHPLAVMTTHVRVPQLDENNMATSSSIFVTEHLRDKMSFGGCIITDDLEMGGAAELGSIREAVVKAALAGHDLMVICHRHDLQREAARALSEALNDGRLSQDDHETSVERITSLYRPDKPTLDQMDREKHQQLAESVARAGVTFLRDHQNVGSRLGEIHWHICRCSNPKLFEEFSSYLPIDRSLQKCGRIFLACNLAEDKEELDRLMLQAENHQGDLVVVLLRSPVDLALIPKSLPVVTAFGSRSCHLQAVAQVLSGQGRQPGE